MRELKGKTAIVTGGSSGIGRGIANALAAEGVRVAITGTNAERLASTTEELRAQGAEVYAVRFDVTDIDAYSDAVNEVETKFGAIDILCNNAGRALLGSITGASIADWEWIIRSNMMSVVHGLDLVVPRMKSRGSEAHILTTASVAGLFASPREGLYSTTKMAVVGMMECLRGELARDNIGVTVFCPHLVRTNIHEHMALRPSGSDEEAGESARTWLQAGMDPDVAGRYAVQGIKDNSLYVLSHPEVGDILTERYQAMISALADYEVDDARLAVEADTLHYAEYQRAIRPERLKTPNKVRG